ncbi:MAG: hypothetical protein JJ863_02185 [Deltaproteobacteria bacterium]|nr:hypothetical protein [Deltaproteobacteria bacterium]
MRLPSLLAALALVLGATVSTASANDAGTAEARGPAVQLRTSLIQSFTPNDGRIWGIGAGLELRHFPGSSDWNWGSFAETRYEIEGAWRVNGGLLLGYGGMALEVGAEHRTMSDDFAAMTAVTIGKRYNWGPMGIGYRLTIPVDNRQPDQGDALATRGVEHTFMLTAGWSFDLVGNRGMWSCHGHGHGNRHN